MDNLEIAGWVIGVLGAVFLIGAPIMGQGSNPFWYIPSGLALTIGMIMVIFSRFY